MKKNFKYFNLFDITKLLGNERMYNSVSYILARLKY